MRPVEVTEEAIIQAGNQLLSANRNITGFALRKAVGGGSAPRLRQVWDDYLSSQALAKVEPVAELPVEVASELKELSDGLVQRLQNMAVGLNDKAVKAAERRVSELVKSVREQQEQSERELSDASMAVDELEAQLDTAAQDKELLQSKLDEAVAINQMQSVEIAQLKERLLAAERATKAANDQHETELATLQANLKEHLAEIAKMRDQLAAADAEVNSKSQALAIELAQVRERLAAAEAGAQVAGQQCAAQTEKAEKAMEEAARYAGQIDVLERQVKDLMEKLSSSAPSTK